MLRLLLLLSISLVLLSCGEDDKSERIVEVPVETVVKDTVYVNKVLKDTVFVTKKDTIVKVRVDTIVKIKTKVDTTYIVDQFLPKKAQEFLKKNPTFIRDYGNHCINNTNQKIKDRIVVTVYWLDDAVPIAKIKNKIIVAGYRQVIPRRTGDYTNQLFYYSIADQDGNFLSEKIAPQDDYGFLKDNESKNIPIVLGKYGYILGGYSYKNLYD